MDKLHERLALVASIDPTGDATGTSTTDVIDMSKFKKVLFIVGTETIAATGTVDFSIQEGTVRTSFNTSTAVGAITQLVAADDNTQALLEIDADALTDGYRYIRGILKQGTANSECAVYALGGDPGHMPASDNDLASVKQIEDI